MIEDIYRDYFHDVFLYLKSITHNDDLAEELTQETFFKALKSVKEFRGDCDIRMWLLRIAKNCYYSFFRKNKYMSGNDVPETEQDKTVSVETRIEDNDTAAAIHRILDEMDDIKKEVFRLRVFSELSFRQIGEVFGKSESWATVTFHRTKLKIIERLEESK